MPTAYRRTSGGSVTLNGGSVTVAGTGSLGLFATGTGSQINATDVTVSTAGSGLANANAILADSGAVVTVNGGSASTTGTDAYVAGSINGATLNLNGTTVTATGDGSGGLAVNGTGSTITATELTITTHGNYDSANNFGPTGATNQSYGEISGGGTLTLTNSSIVTTGTQAPGVYTANGGTTNLTGVHAARSRRPTSSPTPSSPFRARRSPCKERRSRPAAMGQVMGQRASTSKAPGLS